MNRTTTLRPPALSLVCLLGLSAATAEAATYYVSPAGDDARTGTAPDSSWRSLSRVSAQQLAPGDTVLFEGGRTFTGQLALDTSDAGRSDLPVTIASYGAGGPAILFNERGTAVLVYNTAGVRIRDLSVAGGGRDLNTGSGILFYNDLGGDVLLDGVWIENVSAGRFGDYGVEIGAWNGRSGYRNVRIEGVTASENGRGGIFTYAFARAVHRDVYVGSSRAYLNAGFAGLPGNSGNGIVLAGVDGGTIERSVAYGNGWRSNSADGPVGIWTYDSNRVVIQFNEAYGNRTAGTTDGGGFDLDNSTSNSVLQYNYSHDNDGAGFMLAHRWNDRVHSGNAVRYNVSQNDGRKNNYGAIQIWGRITNAEIHNNTVYVRYTSAAAPRGIDVRNTGVEANDPEHVHFRNNIVQTTGSVRLVEVASAAIDNAVDVRFEGNLYWPTGRSFRILWRGTWYGSLGGWRTASGQERVGGVATGLTADPAFAAAGTGPAFGDGRLLEGLYQYRLTDASSAIDRGLDLAAFGVDSGPRDYFGGGPRRHVTYDIGAHEFEISCTWMIAPGSASIPASGDALQAGVSAPPGCSWAALPSQPWLRVIPPAGTGSSSVTIEIDPNVEAVPRTGSIAVGDQTFAVTQTAEDGSSTGREIVLWTAEAPVASGWDLVADSSAAGGVRLETTNRDTPKVGVASASPATYFEMSFEAQAGLPYRLWIRGKAAANSYANDSAFVQFDRSVDAAGSPVYRIGTTSATDYVLQECSGCVIDGWGWQDNGYGTGVTGPLIYFAATGVQRVRVQLREDGLAIDQIVLSSSRFRTSAPGLPRRDSTILPR